MNRHSGTETRAGDETAVAPAAAGGAGAAIIEIEGLRKSYGETIALAGVSLDVHPGETLVLLGASGCGKTTLLRCINRLIEPSSGSIRVCGRDVAFEDPVRLRRGMGYMIQGVGLFPHRRIGENILTAARLAGWSKSEMGERLDALAELVKLPRDLLSRE